MRTTLDLPDPLMRELKARAAMEGVKLKDYFAAMVRDALQKPPALAAEQVRSQVPVFTRKGIKNCPYACSEQSANQRAAGCVG